LQEVEVAEHLVQILVRWEAVAEVEVRLMLGQLEQHRAQQEVFP